MPDITDIIIGLAGSLVLALAGLKLRALAPSGALASLPVGTAIFAFGGLTWAAVMIGFFALSSGLSKLGSARKTALDGVIEKGSRRDVRQVVANGGIPALLAVALPFGPDAELFAAFVGAMAAVNADTWSTEIGTLSRRPPRSILTGRVVAPGTSGGVSPLGTLASIAGGLAIGLIAALMSDDQPLLLIGLLAGFGGGLVDSLLGTSLQRLCWCPRCEQPTERLMHHCGARTVRTRGFSFIDNDVVNLLASLAGAGFGLLANQIA